MLCPKCQFQNREGANFCLECGESFEIQCTQCSKVLPAGAKFCDGCGHDLRKRQEDTPIDYTNPQSYTPKFLAEKILTSRSTIEGEHKLVTVLFADVADFTSMAEKLGLEAVHQIMDRCFKILLEEIHKYEGTINQFTGDGVMALFGAPVAHEDHAYRACHAALSIQKSLENYAEKINTDYGVDFKMRIGLNSGPVIVGAIGDDLRMDYTAVGDTTNLASRIENNAKPGTSRVSANTHRLARDFFEFEALGKIQIKGKKEPVAVYMLVKAGEAETRIDAAVAKGLTRFVGRKDSMTALRDAYDKARAGMGQVVGIVGEAGVGKSRLLFEFNNRLAQEKFTYLVGRCLQYGGAMVYLPVLDILRSYFEIKEGDQEFRIKKKIADRILKLDEKLQGVYAPFYDLLSLNVEDEAYQKLEPMQKREQTFEALRDLLIAESQKKPVILVVEDLHWIDKISEEYLSYLIEWLAGAGILLLLLYRPEYTHSWGSKSYYNRIGLSQLTRNSSVELIRAILFDCDIDPELETLILDRAAAGTQIACLLYTGWVLWMLGYPDKALENADKALSLAHGLSHPFTLGFALWAMAQLNQFRREVQATLKRAESMITLSEKQGFPYWMWLGSTLRAWALVMQGHTQEGLPQMRQSMANQSVDFDKSELPMVYAYAVEAYGQAGQAEEGLGLVTEALALVEKAGFRFFEAELRRTQGELLLRQAAGNDRRAATCLHDALNLARRQQAKSLELRAAMSLSRLWHRQGKRKEAQRLLAEIYNWFTEGFDTADLRDARALIKELN